MFAEVPPLTSLAKGAGCGCKIQPSLLSQALSALPISSDPRLLVGTQTRDDAAVFRLSDDVALVATTDFFTPVVDDPFLFGRIAAANALSDVYAMGATPLFALSLVGFPVDKLPIENLKRILAGAGEVCAEAGISIVGGHSIDDPEPKFGLAVTGSVHPNRVLSNSGARPGDVLMMSKALGVGIALTAHKRGVRSPAIEAAIAQMATLNRLPGEVFAKAQVHALTDITGFGLLGHLWNIVEGSGVQAELDCAAIPVLPGVKELVQKDVVSGGTRRNLMDVEGKVEFPADFPLWKRLILADAQTNGGLLAAVSPDQVGDVLAELSALGVSAVVVGKVREGAAGIFVS